MTEDSNLIVGDLPAEQGTVVSQASHQQAVTPKTGEVAPAVAWVYWVMFGILTLLFLLVASAGQWEGTCVFSSGLIYAVLAGTIYSAYEKEKKAVQKASEDAALLSSIREQYRSIRAQTIIPETAREAVYKSASSNSPVQLAKGQNGVHIWKSEDAICFFAAAPSDAKSLWISEVKVYSIPVSEIEYFAQMGEVFRENKVSGGGGGGSSLGGAVVGGLVAGEAGAVIGSRKKVNEVKSELVTHDTRETVLNYFLGAARHTLYFGLEAYQILNDLIPEKEQGIVSAIKSAKLIKAQTRTESSKSVAEQLRELAELREEGIITEDEFNSKKQQLLAKIT